MNKKGKILPLILLAVMAVSLAQAWSGLPSLKTAQAKGEVSAPEPSGPIFLPLLMRRFPTYNVFGIDIGAITPQNGLNEMVQVGAQWVRRGNYLWPEVEPNKGDRNWSAVASFESELATASQKGLKSILVIQNAPGWAQKFAGVACGPVKADELGTFASFMHDVVARYSQPPYNVQYFEVSNEPDAPLVEANQVFGCWGDDTDTNTFGGGYYGEMLKVVYPQVKSANPNAKMVIGGLLMDHSPSVKNDANAKFMEGILASGAGNSFDVFNFHTYDYYAEGTVGQYGNANWKTAWNTTGPAMNAKIAYIKEILAKYNVGQKPVIATEVALLCYNNCNQDFETTKAAFLAQSYAYALVNGLQSSIWYDIFGAWHNNGLVKADLTPLPAYHAFKTAQSELGQALYLREVTGFKNVKVLEFDKGDGKVWVIWALTTGTEKITLPGQPAAIRDYLGNVLTAQASLNVTNLPIYVEWSK